MTTMTTGVETEDDVYYDDDDDDDDEEYDVISEKCVKDRTTSKFHPSFPFGRVFYSILFFF